MHFSLSHVSALYHIFPLSSIKCLLCQQPTVTHARYRAPGKEVTLRERSSRERSHQHISLTRIISGWRDIAIYRVPAFRSDSTRVQFRAGTTHTHTHIRANAKVNFCASLREKKRSHGKTLIYLVEGAADPRTLDTRSTACIFECVHGWGTHG